MTVCVLGLTGCATTPPQIPDHPPATTHASEHVSQTAPDNAEAAEFAMPTPGPFDPTAPGYKPFKPCEDIPDEVLEDLGVVKGEKGGDWYEPYLCPISVPELEGRGAMSLVTFEQTLDQLTIPGGYEVSEEPGASLPRSAVLVSHEYFQDGACVSGVETLSGFFGISYASWLNYSSGDTLCEIPTHLLNQLYEVENG
ncbi:DUF3558 family protein [Corynebacterium lizhenjunii]|uniref:DUF3558 family protein n=1 Tax=Corynebacterium lizhenjunii TaxID=2709394 RepID=UPI0013ECADBE